MKKLLILSYFLYTAGIVLKLFHIPFNAVIMMVGLLLLLIACLGLAAKPQMRTLAVMHLTIWGWLLVFLFSVKFYPLQMVILILAIVISIGALWGMFRKRLWLQLIPTVGVILAVLYVYLLPTDQRYFVFNIWKNRELSSDYRSWDKYAWFLNVNDRHTDALKASDRALQLVIEGNDQEWKRLIQRHNRELRSGHWKDY